jgi:peptide deformylase
MIKSIITNYHELRKKSEIATYKDDIKSIIQDLKDTLANNGHGYALAAPQIGVYKQICYCKIPKDVNSQTKEITYLELVLINPIIVEKEKIFIHYNEGCLSFPGLRVNTDRYKFIVLNYEDENFKKKTALFDELQSLVVQHEIAHLQGRTIIEDKHRRK